MGGTGWNPGPDLIASDLTDCDSFGTVGGTGLFSYSLGVAGCNVGNVNVLWNGTTASHPVIAQNVYRYLPPAGPMVLGRFEQVGMSWAKHSFDAEEAGNGSSICGTCNGQIGVVLGVGCSDVYSASVNGSQGALGPRSEINASTGVFPFVTPHPWPPITDALSRRIQINAADIDPAANPGAQYFGEVLYVAADDAAAGNGWNNASFAPVSFDTTASNMDMTLSGPTQQLHPAILAWSQIENGVQLAGVDVPGDGRFWLAHNVTSNGDGTWHYEYALLNFNSDRSGGSFIVPIAPGTAITNPGFHAVPSHSGEPYSNAAWTIAVGSTSVTFSVPQGYVQNVNDNALRWGTLYNFRFDASAEPAEGDVVIGLFKPGLGDYSSLNAMTVAGRTPGGAAGTPPAVANDECPNAALAHSGENRLSTQGATASSPPACMGVTGDVWFSYTYHSYTPGCSGSIVFDTCGSEISTVLAVYAGSCPSAPEMELGCAEPGTSTCSQTPLAAMVSVPAVEGRTYLIRVGSPVGGGQGNIVMNVTPPFCVPPDGACCAADGTCQISQGAASCFTGAFQGSNSVCDPSPCPAPPPPANDECAGAIPIGDSAAGWPSMNGSNVSADLTVNDVCDGSSGQSDVWYSYVPMQSAQVIVDTCQLPPSGVGMDTILSLHSGACDGPLIACNDDYCDVQSQLSANLAAGTVYYIRVCGYGTDTGDFTLRVRGGGGWPVGACCSGSTCTLTAPLTCSGSAQHFAGLNVACNASGNNTTPCCRADFDGNGHVAVQDIFDFLSAWFARQPSADFDSSGTDTVQDIFDFLAAWFVGCH